jgi:hypothetical protein
MAACPAHPEDCLKSLADRALETGDTAADAYPMSAMDSCPCFASGR